MADNKNSGLPWFMRLTLVNTQTGRTTFAMYPQDQYSIFESLDCCQLPYGSGDYTHRAVSANGVPADSLQEALTGVIESEKRPPTIQELNYLGGQIQRMTVAGRARLEQRLLERPDATIIDAINAAHDLLGEQELYDGVSMAERPFILDSGTPYLRVQLVPNDGEDYENDEDGVWVDCPAGEEELAEAARKMGACSYQELFPNMIVGLLGECGLMTQVGSPFLSIDDINDLAHTMKQGGAEQLCKLKAVLESEGCTDFDIAAAIAKRLDDYEYFPEAELRLRCQDVGLTVEDAVDALGIEETDYGFVRKADEQSLNQELCRAGWNKLVEQNKLAELVDSMYDLTDGMCSAGPGPYGIGVHTEGDSKIHLVLKFDPDPVLNNQIFPSGIEGYTVQVSGFWYDEREFIQPEELGPRLANADPATKTVARALQELSTPYSVSAAECNDVFRFLAKVEMGEIGPFTADKQEAANDNMTIGPALGQL